MESFVIEGYLIYFLIKIKLFFSINELKFYVLEFEKVILLNIMFIEKNYVVIIVINDD